MRRGILSLQDQEIGRDRDQFPQEEEFQHGRGARQSRHRQQQDRKQTERSRAADRCDRGRRSRPPDRPRAGAPQRCNSGRSDRGISQSPPAATRPSTSRHLMRPGRKSTSQTTKPAASGRNTQSLRDARKTCDEEAADGDENGRADGRKQICKLRMRVRPCRSAPARRGRTIETDRRLPAASRTAPPRSRHNFRIRRGSSPDATSPRSRGTAEGPQIAARRMPNTTSKPGRLASTDQSSSLLPPTIPASQNNPALANR